MESHLERFAERYAEAWSSQHPESVSAFYAPDGSLTVNGGEPAIGRSAITGVAESFMTAFPDMVVSLDRLVEGPEGLEFHWTLSGTNTGPGGTGNRVQISGHEAWRLNEEGLIAESKGHFDASEYERQLAHGVEAP
ncbi:MAG: ester cyclase [Gemmatimonadota bacterium]|nr:ester cyclase [Gemmatimonadota bacterium]